MHAMIVVGILTLLAFAPHLAWPQATPGYTMHQVKIPNAYEVLIRGINDRPAARGDLVGTYRHDDYGHVRFVKYGSAFLTFDPSDEDPCHWPNAINNHRVIVGEYCTLNEDYTTRVYAGFENIGSSREHTEQAHVALMAPNAGSTVANGNNDAGDIVGTLYQEETGDTYGFHYEDGEYQFFDIPEGAYGWVEGINDHGHIVGSYFDYEFDIEGINGDACCWRGFLMKDGKTTVINVTGDAATSIAGINNAGHIAGTFYRPVSDWHPQGFVAVPKVK